MNATTLGRLILAIVALSADGAAALDVSWRSARVNGYVAGQSGGGYVGSLQASWTPSLRVAPFGLRGNLGATVLKDPFGERFPSVNAQALLGYRLGRVELELGGGLQTWIDGGGTHPIASADLSWIFARGRLRFLDRWFLGYSRFFLPDNATHELRLGVGAAF